MDTITPDLARKFCELCNWAYECWTTHKKLFDQNPSPEQTLGKAAYFHDRLSTIIQEYSLLQICKLHDPAVQGKSLSLTIDYMIRFADWGLDEENITRLSSNLAVLYGKIAQARNKLIAHNDLEIIAQEKPLGVFAEGLDDEYFAQLQELVNCISNKWLDGPYPFNDLAGADAMEFLTVLDESQKTSHVLSEATSPTT